MLAFQALWAEAAHLVISQIAWAPAVRLSDAEQLLAVDGHLQGGSAVGMAQTMQRGGPRWVY